MRIRYSILLFAFSLGCQTRPMSMIDCTSNRTPASSAEKCSSVFTKQIKAPTSKDMSNFFRQLEEFGFSESDILKKIDDGYLAENISTLEFENFYEPDINRNLFHTTTAKILGQRQIQKDSTTKILLELGYESVSGNLMPPRDLAGLYSRIFDRLVNSATKAGVAESNIIYPAFLFSRKNPQTNTKEMLFVRPGIDSPPKATEGWKISTRSFELSPAEFNRMLQERKFLLEPGMFFHDMGHIIDFIERPQYMVAFREYSEKKQKALHDPSVPPAVLWHTLGQVAIRGDIERYMNEWIYLPSEKNISQIKSTISDLNFSSPNSLTSLQESYKKLSSLELLQKSKAFLKERYVLFSSHGGGSRDFSVERYLTPLTVIKGFEEIFMPEGQAILPRALNDLEVQLRDPDRSYRQHEAPGFFMRLSYLIDLKEGKEVPLEISDFLKQHAVKLGSTDFMSYLDLQMAYHLAEIQFRLQMALHYKMTPEQIAQDTALLYERDGWENYKKTKTSQYYSTYRPYTMQWVLGYDVGRRNPHYPPIKWPPE